MKKIRIDPKTLAPCTPGKLKLLLSLAKKFNQNIRTGVCIHTNVAGDKYLFEPAFLGLGLMVTRNYASPKADRPKQDVCFPLEEFVRQYGTHDSSRSILAAILQAYLDFCWDQATNLQNIYKEAIFKHANLFQAKSQR